MKDMTIKLNASEASGEAYWRKRCDVVEAELSSLRAVNEELKANVLLLQTEYLRQNPCTDPQDTIDELEREADRLRAVNAVLVEALAGFAMGMIIPPLMTEQARQLMQWQDAARDALSRAHQVKPEPETCVWIERADGYYNASCGITWPPFSGPEKLVCPGCGKRVEVKSESGS